MVKLFKNLHLILFLYTGFVLFTKWEEHQIIIEQLDTQIPVLEGNIRDAKREKRDLENYVKDIDEARNRIELVALEVEKTQQQLPSEISDAQNFSIIREAAESLNIREVSITPSEEVLRGFYYAKTYNITAKGTFLQFLIFFEKIGESTRLLNIRNLTIIRSQQQQRGRFQLLDFGAAVEAYRYNQDYKEDRGVEDIKESIEPAVEQPPAGRRRIRINPEP